MGNSTYWIIGLIILFMLGSVLNVRVSPREKALGQLRERARKMGLNPRLIAAPAWIHHQTPSGKSGGMVAFYSVMIPDGKMPLTQALVKDQKLQVERGNQTLNQQPLTLYGAYAVEMQSNYVGIYWDEEADLHGQQLDVMKETLLRLAQPR